MNWNIIAIVGGLFMFVFYGIKAILEFIVLIVNLVSDWISKRIVSHDKVEEENFVVSVREYPERVETSRELSPETGHPKSTGKNNVNEIESTHNKNGKACSICGKWYPFSEFEYGNRENRSYCKKCNSEEKAAYSQGGVEAARRYREEKRAKWK